MSDDFEAPKTIMFPEFEKIGYRSGKHLIIFSAKSLSKELIITFPFEVLFFTLPLNEELIIAVDTEKPDTIVLYNFQKNEIVNSLSVGGNIQQFHSSYNFGCAVFSLGAIVFCCNPLILLYTLRTPFTPSAIDIISTPSDQNHCIFTHEDEINKGTLTVHRIPSSNPSISFRCCKSGIRWAAVSNDGKYIATTSTKGTIVRLWDIHGKLIQESRRGFFSAKIEHVSFSPDSLFFCVCSNHQTAHVFKCEKNEEEGYFLPKAEIRVSLESSKNIAAYILEGGHSLCLINDKGTCLIYSIDIATGKSGLKSQIMLPTIAKMICPKD